MAAYATYFDNLFEALRMSRPTYKAQASYTARAVRGAALGKEFAPLLADLDAAIGTFDENLSERQASTAGTTDAYQQARTAWLAFVDDAMKDDVTPRLRKLPQYADFKKFGKSRLAALPQPELLSNSQALVALYTEHLALLKNPTLATDAAHLLQAVAATDETRDARQADTKDTILALGTGRAAIARAQRRLKAQLELEFDEPAKVYSFFDFSAAEAAHKVQKRKKDKSPGATAAATS